LRYGSVESEVFDIFGDFFDGFVEERFGVFILDCRVVSLLAMTR
jgi:hypothetical protein